MKPALEMGESNFKELIDGNKFYIDKTHFIEEWCNSAGKVTLITRPRRFGKTLNMSMLEYFLSNRYKDQAYLFEKLYIFNCNNSERFKKMQGEYPVINLSFASIKYDTFEETIDDLKDLMAKLYIKHEFLLETGELNDIEIKKFKKIMSGELTNIDLKNCLNNLSGYLKRYTGKNVYILLDEYDTPLQEAYSLGYWEELTDFITSFFENTFKENDALNRAILTGITRVAKESIFSGLNNLRVITIISESYAECFGFTETETFKALDMYGLSDKKEEVKRYYDGFIMEKRLKYIIHGQL